MYYTLHVRAVEATDIPRMDSNATDAYCILQANGQTQTTFVAKNSMNPRWNQEFHFNVTAPQAGSLRITMRDKDAFKDDNISYIDIMFTSLPIGQVIDQWYNMVPFSHVRKGGRLHLVLHMAPANTPPFVPSAGFAPGYPQPGMPAMPPQPYPQPGMPAMPAQPYPQPGYGAMPPPQPYPQPGYGAMPPPQPYPQPGYGAPPPVYGAPPPVYGAPPVYGGQPYPSMKPGYPGYKKHKNHYGGYGRRSSSSSS